MKLLSSIKFNIAKKLENKEYFHKFFKGQSEDEIAEAIRDLRDKRDCSQIGLAELTGMKQSAISRIEKPSYARWNFQTLWRVAKALDARWKFVLEPREWVLEEYKEKEKQINADKGEYWVEYKPHNDPNKSYVVMDRKGAFVSQPRVIFPGEAYHTT
ncbi:MAG: helix-turn-helix domain-containing protein [Nitrospiria bacterium]